MDSPSDAREHDYEDALADAESSADAAWEVTHETNRAMNEVTAQLVRLRYAAQRAYDWHELDINDWDDVYHEPWGKVDASRDIYEPLGEALKSTDYAPITSDVGIVGEPFNPAHLVALEERIKITTVAPVTVGTYSRCICTDEVWRIDCEVAGHGWEVSRKGLAVAIGALREIVRHVTEEPSDPAYIASTANAARLLIDGIVSEEVNRD